MKGQTTFKTDLCCQVTPQADSEIQDPIIKWNKNVDKYLKFAFSTNQDLRFHQKISLKNIHSLKSPKSSNNLSARLHSVYAKQQDMITQGNSCPLCLKEFLSANNHAGDKKPEDESTQRRTKISEGEYEEEVISVSSASEIEREMKKYISSLRIQKQKKMFHQDYITKGLKDLKKEKNKSISILSPNRKMSLSSLLKQQKKKENSFQEQKIKKTEGNLRLGRSVCTVVSEAEEENEKDKELNVEESVIFIDFFHPQRNLQQEK